MVILDLEFESSKDPSSECAEQMSEHRSSYTAFSKTWDLIYDSPTY